MMIFSYMFYTYLIYMHHYYMPIMGDLTQVVGLIYEIFLKSTGRKISQINFYLFIYSYGLTNHNLQQDQIN